MSNITYKWISEDERTIIDTIANDSNYEWEHSEDYFRELLHLKRVLVAYDADAPIGYLLFQVIWGNAPFLSQIWINETYHRQGIATAMYEQLEERLRTEGYDSVTTSNETKNDMGIGFVESLGFQEIGTLQMEHGPEVFSLKKL